MYSNKKYMFKGFRRSPFHCLPNIDKDSENKKNH